MTEQELKEKILKEQDLIGQSLSEIYESFEQYIREPKMSFKDIVIAVLVLYITYKLVRTLWNRTTPSCSATTHSLPLTARAAMLCCGVYGNRTRTALLSVRRSPFSVRTYIPQI